MRKIIYSTKPIFINYFFKKINIGQKLTSYIKPDPPVPPTPGSGKPLYNLKTGDIFDNFYIIIDHQDWSIPETIKEGKITFKLWMGGEYVTDIMNLRFENNQIIFFDASNDSIIRSDSGEWALPNILPFIGMKVEIISNTMPNIKTPITWGFQDATISNIENKSFVDLKEGDVFRVGGEMNFRDWGILPMNVTGGEFIVNNKKGNYPIFHIYFRDGGYYYKRPHYGEEEFMIFKDGVWGVTSFSFTVSENEGIIIVKNTLPVSIDGTWGWQYSDGWVI